MNASIAEIERWIEAEFPQLREDWFTFLRFKTISADPASRPEMEKCAEWLRRYFEKLDCKAEVIQTPVYPLVYAEDLSAGRGKPTLLIYGHYDVQPVDPLELWHSDPFEPVVRDGEVYARGAVDDKGQIFYAMVALAFFRKSGRKLPINLKFCIEGEEEFGSEGLMKSLSLLKEKMRADDLMVVDFDIIDRETPSINLGARGIVTMEVVLKGSTADLHSGAFGGIAYNPNRALAELIAQFWNQDGKIQVPHFYDDVVEPSPEEKTSYAGEGLEKNAQAAGIQAFSGEKGKTMHEAHSFRPTLEINGMAGGYAGPGFKTVIPAEARAKISCRLVPNQDPDTIARRVAEFVKSRVKKGIAVEVQIHHGGKPYRSAAQSKLADALSRAYEKMFGKPCKKTLAGGSIPVVADLMKATGSQVVGMGYCLADDNIHAPNEHFGIDRFKKGIATVALAIQNLGEG